MFVVFGLALVCAFQFLSAMRKAMRTAATSGTQTAPGTLFRHCTGKAADGVQDGEYSEGSMEMVVFNMDQFAPPWGSCVRSPVSICNAKGMTDSPESEYESD